MIPISKPMMASEEKEAVLKVLDSGMIAAGQKVKEFEAEFAKYVDAKHAIAVSNGTCSLHTALFMNGIGKGHRVITTPFTFIATGNSILHAGAEPVFADIDGNSFNISPEAIEKELKKDIFKKIKAIMVVHLFGQACEMDKITALAQKHGVKIIEDAAQAHGAKYRDKKAGTFGDGGSFSMYATKNMTTAEGGMVTTDSDQAAGIARSFINHGSEKTYYHTRIGYNYRTTDIEAAIGLAQLKKLDSFNNKRRENAARLKKMLAAYAWIVTPEEAEGNFHIYHQFTVKVTNGKRDALLKSLNDSGVGAKIFYPLSLHQQPFYKQILKRKYSLPISEKIANEVLSLPVGPALTDADFKTIEEAFMKFAKTI